MKKLISILSAGAVLVMFWACEGNDERYIDLSTGKPVNIEKDDKTGVIVNKDTREPLYIYVDTRDHDTIYAKTGQVINGHIIRDNDNKFVYDQDEKLKIDRSGEVGYKEGDYKVKIEKDGDVKIKTDDKKVKIDGESGERKVKND